MANTSACAASSSEKAPIRPLHDCACFFISLSHTLLERITHMPFPIGPIIKRVEITVDRWTHPLTQSLERRSLCILAAVDDKIFAVGSFAGGCLFCTAAQVKKVLSLLYTQGIVGTSASLWLKYEDVVKQDIEKAVCLANRVPLVKLVTPVVCAVSSPLAMAISDWLLKQGKRLEQGTRMVDSSSAIARQEVEIESLNIELEALSCIDAATVINMVVDDVHPGGKVVSGEDFLKYDGKTEEVDDFVKHPSEKDVSMDDVILGETHTLSVCGLIEDDIHLADASTLGAVNADEHLMEAGEATESLGDDNLPDVLEMIESSWLMGKSSYMTKAPHSAQTRLISKPRAYGFNIRIKTFFCG